LLMSSFKHHDKVTFFEFTFFTFLSKAFFCWACAISMDYWAFNYSSSNSLSCNNQWRWDSSKGSFIVVAVRKVITFSWMGKSASIP
jgi:hypothetical protein